MRDNSVTINNNNINYPGNHSPGAYGGGVGYGPGVEGGNFLTGFCLLLGFLACIVWWKYMVAIGAVALVVYALSRASGRHRARASDRRAARADYRARADRENADYLRNGDIFGDFPPQPTGKHARKDGL